MMSCVTPTWLNRAGAPAAALALMAGSSVRFFLSLISGSDLESGEVRACLHARGIEEGEPRLDS
jgi:hypothetical protein